MKKAITYLPLIGILLILLFPQISAEATLHGFSLFLTKVFPSIFPFLLLSNIFMNKNNTKVFASHKTYAFLYLFFSGFLCGCPMGAKATKDCIEHSIINPSTLIRLLPGISQFSPAFILSFVYISVLEKNNHLFLFLLSIYLPCILYIFAILIFANIKKNQTTDTSLPHINSNIFPQTQISCNSTPLMNAINTTMRIGIIVTMFMLFSKITGHLLMLLHLSPFYINGITSLLETTSGLLIVKDLYMPELLKQSFVIFLTAFGGFSMVLQVKDILDADFKTMFYYTITKILLAFASSILYFLISFI